MKFISAGWLRNTSRADDGADRRRRGANGRARRTRRRSRASWMRARLGATVRARSLTHSAALGRDRARREAKCGGAAMATAKGGGGRDGGARDGGD